MVKKCLLCKKSAAKDSDVTFHCFPRDDKGKKSWLEPCELKMKDITSDSCLCSQHFPVDSFIVGKTGHGRELKKNALPIIFKKPEPVKSRPRVVVPAIGGEVEVETTVDDTVMKNEVEEEIEVTYNSVVPKNEPKDVEYPRVVEDDNSVDIDLLWSNDSKAELYDHNYRENHMGFSIKYYRARTRVLKRKMQALRKMQGLRTLVRTMRNTNNFSSRAFEQLRVLMQLNEYEDM